MGCSYLCCRGGRCRMWCPPEELHRFGTACLAVVFAETARGRGSAPAFPACLKPGGGGREMIGDAP